MPLTTKVVLLTAAAVAAMYALAIVVDWISRYMERKGR